MKQRSSEGRKWPATFSDLILVITNSILCFFTLFSTLFLTNMHTDGEVKHHNRFIVAILSTVLAFTAIIIWQLFGFVSKDFWEMRGSLALL